MRNNLLFVSALIANIFVNAQNATALSILDTRDENLAPNQYSPHTLKTEFKLRSAVSVPGEGLYSGMLTLTPWGDNSGNKHHQVNFNDGGIFYRTGLPESSNWDGWKRILTTETNGNFSLINSGNTSLKVSNDFGSFQIGRSACDGCYGVSTGGTVLRNLGLSHDILLYMPNDNNDGKSFIGFGDDANRIWIKIFNNRIARFDGQVLAKEIQIKTNIWADYVFKKEYHLPTLQDVEKHIIKNGHLPDIPSEKEALQNGINIGEFQIKLLQKIEELTLYSIEQNKKILEQNSKIDTLQKQLQEVLSKSK